MSKKGGGPDESDSVLIQSNVDVYVYHESRRFYFPARYVLAILSFAGFANVYALRVNLSVAIVAMTTSDTTPVR